MKSKSKIAAEFLNELSADSKLGWSKITNTPTTLLDYGITDTNIYSATKLQTARTINGVSFDGTQNITITDSTKAPLASPVLIGTPTAPTAADGNNTLQIANTTFVNNTVKTATLVYYASGVGTAGIAASTNYALFPAASDTITLSIGTYKIRIQALVTVATSTVSATLLLNPKGAGTAVGTVFGESFGSITNGGVSNLTAIGSTALGTAFTVTAASAVAGRAYNAVFEGILNVSTAGTLIPSYMFSAALTSGVTTLNAANYIIIEKISDTVITKNGGWN